MTTYLVDVDGARFEVEVGPHGVRVNGRRLGAELLAPEGLPRCLRLDGRSIPLLAARGAEPGAWTLELAGRAFTASALEPHRRRLAQRAAAGSAAAAFRLVAPMPGLVVEVEVRPGDPVRTGQGLVIMEAMKMENELRSEIDGVVETVWVRPRQTVERGDPLVLIAEAKSS